MGSVATKDSAKQQEQQKVERQMHAGRRYGGGCAVYLADFFTTA